MDHPPMVLMHMRRELLAVRAHCDVPDMLAEHYEMNDAFNFANRLQQYRACKGFEVTFLRMEEGPAPSIAPQRTAF